jgi:AraC-like DNA-binding protein
METAALTKYANPSLEKILTPAGGSIHVRQFDDVDRNTRPYWHYHPELEIVYVNGGSGKRHIGSHLSYFHDGELIMIGSNLPHQGFTHRLSLYKTETVVQMLPDFMGSDFLEVPEMQAIKKLFERAQRGISFHGESKDEIGRRVEALPKQDAFQRILSMMGILNDMATTNEYTILNAEGFSMEIATNDNDRINIVLNYIRKHFQENISLSEIADLINMTEPSFCRYFKKITSKTFTQFINEYRLVHASKLLSEGKLSIAQVCYESGFNNYSHFTKQFKAFAGKSPSEYRGEVKQLV